MSYLTQAKLQSDQKLRDRITACAATEGEMNPSGWVYENMWVLSSQPGWVDAYASAVAAGDEEPGANEGAITDQMVLSAVQHLLERDVEHNEPGPTRGDGEGY